MITTIHHRTKRDRLVIRRILPLITGVLVVVTVFGQNAPAGQDADQHRFFLADGRFFLADGRFLLSEDESLKTGEQFCVFTNAGFSAACISSWGQYEDNDFNKHHFPIISLEAGLTSGHYSPAIKGRCSEKAYSAKVEEGRRTILPVELAKELSIKASADFHRAVAEQRYRGAYEAWDSEFIAGSRKPWKEWRVRLFKMKNCTIADIWIDFIDQVKFEINDPHLDYDTELHENHHQVGAVHYIVRLGRSWQIIREDTDGVAGIRGTLHLVGSYYSGYRIFCVTDMDGDGRPEILIPSGGTESYGETLYLLIGAELRVLAEFGYGV